MEVIHRPFFRSPGNSLRSSVHHCHRTKPYLSSFFSSSHRLFLRTTPRILPPNPFSSVVIISSSPSRCRRTRILAHSNHLHQHDDHASHAHDHHSHSHGHGHGHGHGHYHGHSGAGEQQKLTRAQGAVLRFARAVGWARLADFLRVHLQLCCCSMGLLLAAAASPYLLPKTVVSRFQNVSILLAFPIVGVSSALDATVDIAAGRVNIHVLMALAAFASVFMGNSLEGALLLAMFNLSHIAEEYFTSRSMIDVKDLKDNHPEFALVLEGRGSEEPDFSELEYKKIPVRDLEVGAYLLVRAGEAVPVDCEVHRGSSTVTIEHLSGETKPLEKQAGDRIPGGARNLEGMMIVKVTKSWEDSTLNKIMQLTEEGQLNKPKLQRWLDEFGEYYSKFVVALSLAVAIVGPFLFNWPVIGTSVKRGSIYRALGLMVAASPCALAVAPLAYAIAISSCARKGILLKGGHVLDALASCRIVAFDKTGTLTTGALTCKAIEPIHGHKVEDNQIENSSCCNPNCENEALAVAVAMEKGTTHPIGRAVLDHSLGKKLTSVSIESFQCLPGRGLSATLTGIESGISGTDVSSASLGSVEYIASLCKSDIESEKLKEAVKMSTYGSGFVQAALSVNKKVTLFHFEDEPRVGTASVISSLRNKGKLRVMMLTGDHNSSASRVAKAVGIDEIYSNLKPEDKLNHVKSTSRDMGGGLIMVGDGINDAPALAAATVGIVLAQRASATAIAVADVLLLQEDISSVPFCIAKARQTTSLVKQSVALALSCIFFAALPSVLGFLPLWLTVLLHEGGTLLVCLNSVRALNDPSWSWMHNVRQMLEWFRASLAVIFKQLPPSGTTAQTANV